MFGIDPSTACRIDKYTTRYQSAAGDIDVVQWGENQWYVETVEPLTETTAHPLALITANPAPTERLATLLDAAQRREAGALTAYYELEADILAAYPAVETLTAYTLRVLGEPPTAPVVEAAQPDDLVARLEDAAEVYKDFSCDCDTDLYTDAADEIRRLQAELEALRGTHAETTKALQDLLNGEPITRVQKEDGEHWEVSVRYLRQSYYANGLTEADARARANDCVHSQKQ